MNMGATGNMRGTSVGLCLGIAGFRLNPLEKEVSSALAGGECITRPVPASSKLSGLGFRGLGFRVQSGHPKHDAAKFLRRA